MGSNADTALNIRCTPNLLDIIAALRSFRYALIAKAAKILFESTLVRMGNDLWSLIFCFLGVPINVRFHLEG